MGLVGALLSVGYAADPVALRAGMEESAGWRVVETKALAGVGDVVVHHKVVLGEDCLAGETVAALDPDVLLTAATDVENQPMWSSWTVPEARRLSVGATSFDYVQLLDNPSPVADRYWFVHARTSTEAGVRIFRWDQLDAELRYPAALADLRTRYPNAVSTRTNLGDWTFSPDVSGTRIRYRICTDAGGNIPRWLGEIAARSTLPGNIGDLVKEVRRRTGLITP
ncbi:MAG: hypothetical protein EXR71_10575 [Myxococcales bacterium]|nr:hypothetical protein [Myxococcales bacterium]